MQFRDFQPRLGVVARTLARALPALLHMMLLISVLLLLIPYLLCIMFGETTAQLCTLRGKHASCKLPAWHKLHTQLGLLPTSQE